MRPLIGVTTSVRGSAMSWLFNKLAVSRAGGRAVRFTSKTRDTVDELDGLIIGGGDDINAELYGGEIQINIRVDEERDRLEQKMLADALQKKLPIFGICRGAQMINIHFGGSLHVDIHEVYKEVPRMRSVLPKKSITIEPNSHLYKILREKRHKINCLHHQSMNRLGKGLNIVGKDDHGIVQAIESPAYPFLIGVQWHPEYLPLSPTHQRLFRSLVQKARGLGLEN